MLLEKNDTLIMMGDSVTDVGRAQPVGDGLFAAEGTGYPALVSALLRSAYPELNLRIINMGTSGNNVLDLKARWQADVIDRDPDWVSILIGINDVWRQFDCMQIADAGVPLDTYEKTLEELVEKTLPRVKGVFLLSPYYIETCEEDRMRARMDQYRAAVRRVAEKTGCPYLDTQEVFCSLLQHMHSSYITWDRVHPNLFGHMALARAFVEMLGFDYTKKP